MNDMKATTNRERSCFFSFHSDPPSSLPFLVTASPGTAITGFYGTQVSKYLIMSTATWDAVTDSQTMVASS